MTEIINDKGSWARVDNAYLGGELNYTQLEEVTFQSYMAISYSSDRQALDETISKEVHMLIIVLIGLLNPYVKSVLR